MCSAGRVLVWGANRVRDLPVFSIWNVKGTLKVRSSLCPTLKKSIVCTTLLLHRREDSGKYPRVTERYCVV